MNQIIKTLKQGNQAMHLISCDNCGAVFDQNKLKFCHEDHLETRADEFIWDGDDYVPFVPCGVCAAPITKETK